MKGTFAGHRDPIGSHTRRFSRWEPPALVVIAAVVVAWYVPRTFLFDNAADFGLAYDAGALAWRTGHPETLWYWTGDPFLAMSMAVVARVLSMPAATAAMCALNLGLVLGTLAVTWWRLRPHVTKPVWWLTLVAAVLFAPLMSSAWWKQFEILALALAAAGFVLARAGRVRSAGALIALSVSVKPVIVLLPLALLLRRDTRRAGLCTLLWLAVLNGAAQLFMAWRARSLDAASPLIFLQSFGSKSAPPNPVPCDAINFGPGSLVCRLVGMEHFTTQRVLTYCLVLLLAVLAAWALGLERGRSWGVFAFAAMLSPMASTIDWSHYQVLLAPLFLVLAFTYSTYGASWPEWLALAAAYALCELTLDPFGTLPGTVVQYVTGRGESAADFTFWISFAQFAQYMLFGLAFAWFRMLRARGLRMEG